jgi:hypothetical protein
MAGSAIAVLPLPIAFVFSARPLVAGLTTGAVRGWSAAAVFAFSPPLHETH